MEDEAIHTKDFFRKSSKMEQNTADMQSAQFSNIFYEIQKIRTINQEVR